MGGLLKRDELAKDLPCVSKWLELCEPTRRIAEEQLAHLDAHERLDRTIELNVLAQLNNLRSHPSVAARLYQGELRLHGWVYDIGSGHVKAFDSESGLFESIVDSNPKSVEPTHGAKALVA
jgi:carbonic anhydrase